MVSDPKPDDPIPLENADRAVSALIRAEKIGSDGWTLEAQARVLRVLMKELVGVASLAPNVIG